MVGPEDNFGVLDGPGEVSSSAWKYKDGTCIIGWQLDAIIIVSSFTFLTIDCGQ